MPKDSYNEYRIEYPFSWLGILAYAAPVSDELEVRLNDNAGFKINRGEIFEKGITPMRSFMIDNMQHGRLFLAGDAAHIVPPTGGKGLNLAVADIRFLSKALIKALIKALQTGENDLIKTYSQDCLRRVWRTQDFSNCGELCGSEGHLNAHTRHSAHGRRVKTENNIRF